MLPHTEEFEYNDFFSVANPKVKFGYIDHEDLRLGTSSGKIFAEGRRNLSIYKFVRKICNKELKTLKPLQTSHSDIRHLLLEQPRGQDGDLFVDGRGNLFFVCGLIVEVAWRKDSWHIYGHSFTEALTWDEQQYFVRDV